MIHVKFKDCPVIHIQLKDTELAPLYQELVKKNYEQEFPRCYDSAKYNDTYLRELATEVKDLLGWNWLHNDYSVEVTTQLHKDLETYLAKGFEYIPEEYDNILTELHQCLHAVETKRVTNAKRDATVTIEWFNDEYLPMPDSFKFSNSLEFGDVKLQNAYVGHQPVMIYDQKDASNISQTCRFLDRVKPGITIHSIPYTSNVPPLDEYTNWWKTTVPDFVAAHGMDKILRYTGWAVIGKITNLDDYRTVLQSDNLVVEEITFTDT